MTFIFCLSARIGDDVSALVSKFVNGVSMESTRLEGVPEVNNLDVIVGQVSNYRSRQGEIRACYCYAICCQSFTISQ